MKSRFFAISCLLVLGAIGPSPAITLSAPLPPSFTPHSLLDDVPAPLAPEHPTTEADRDRVEAVSLFAVGRTHEQREEFPEALQCYERALRRDPQSSAIVQAIIPLAVRLKRYEEGVRYVLAAGKLKDADPLQLRQLGAYLTEQGDYTRAAALYEKALFACGKNDKTAANVLLQMELGLLCRTTGKQKEAADCFIRVLDAVDHPDKYALDEQFNKLLFHEQAQTYQLIGECFLAADRPEDARAAFERIEKLAPGKAMRQFNLARMFLETNKPAEALAALDLAFAEHLPDQDAAPYEALAEALSKLGKSGELIDRLERLRAAEPNALPLGWFLASQYVAAGKLDKAETLYLELLKKQPASVGYRGLFDLYRKSKRFDALLSAMGESVEKTGVLETLDTESRTVSGDADAMREIMKTARSKIQTAPDKCGYGERLAAALLALEAKQYETAGEFFDMALAAKPKRTAEAFLVWGVGLLAGDRAVEAAKVFQRAIDQKMATDDNAAFHFYLAGALALAGQTDGAVAAAKTAAEARKDSARFRGRPAWVLSIAKRNDEATTAYRTLIDEFDADRGSAETRDVMREARLALSNLAVLKGDLPQAEEWIEQVLDEFPDDQGAMNDLGYLWADENKNLGRARRMIQAAVDAQPDNMAYRDSLGWVLFRQGEFAEAVAELERAAADPKLDGVVLDHLGDAYRKANRPDKAVEAWRKAAELLRKDKEADKVGLIEKKILQIAN